MAQGGIIMCRIGYCPGCRRHGMLLTNHHNWKRSVWGRNKKKNSKTTWLCRDCHTKLEVKISKKEGKILRQHPEIYIDTLNDFLQNAEGRDPDEAIIEEAEVKQQRPKKVRSREKQRGDPLIFPGCLAILY